MNRRSQPAARRLRAIAHLCAGTPPAEDVDMKTYQGISRCGKSVEKSVESETHGECVAAQCGLSPWDVKRP